MTLIALSLETSVIFVLAPPHAEESSLTVCADQGCLHPRFAT